MSQCWAFNKEGVRCEQDTATHAAKHSYTQEWNDDDCFSPIINQIPEPQTPTPPPLPEPMPEPAGCIACGHKHKGGECKCGCYEYIG